MEEKQDIINNYDKYAKKRQDALLKNLKPSHRFVERPMMRNIKDLRRMMEVEEKFVLGDDELIIGQLELVNAKDFLKKNKNEIDKILDDVRLEFGINIVFINIIDILKGYHIIYSPYEETRNYIQNDYQFFFDGEVFFEDKILLRKEIKNI